MSKLVMGYELLVRGTKSHNYQPITHNQQGIASLLILLLLVSGIGLGTYLVQQRTNILPFALDSNNCENGYRFLGGDAGDDNNWVRDTDCDGKGDPGEKDSNDDYEYKYTECTNEKPGQVRDVYQNSDGEYKTDNIRIEEGECGLSKDSKDDSSNDDTDFSDDPDFYANSYCEDNKVKRDGTTVDNCSFSSQGFECIEGDGGAKCVKKSQGGNDTEDPEDDTNQAPDDDRADSSTEACRDNPPGANKPDGYNWVAYCDVKCSKNSDCPKNESSGFVNPNTSNWCYGGRCLKLVTDDDQEVVDTQRRAKNARAIQGGASFEHNSGSLDVNEDQLYLEKYNSALDKLVSVARGAGSDPAVKTAELDNSIGKAQEAVRDANQIIEECKSGARTQNCSDSELHELYNRAKIATRLAFFDGVGEGVQNTCTKVDMGIGNQINVTANDGTSGRLYLCTTKNPDTLEIERVWRVYDSAGNPHEVSNATYQKGVGGDWWDKVPSSVKEKYNQANCLILGGCSGNNSPVQTSQSSTSTACLIGRQSPSLSAACVSCIKGKHSDLIGSVRNGEPTKFAACSDGEVLNYWCNGGVSSGATTDCSTKKNECGSVCGTSSTSTSAGGIFTTATAAKEACKKLSNTKWNDSTNRCQVDCTGTNSVWSNGQCRSSCPSNTDLENVTGVGKYCTTNDIYPFPSYQSSGSSNSLPGVTP